MSDSKELRTFDVSALPPEERASKLLKFDETKAELAALAEKSVRIVEITNPAGRTECHSAYMALKTARVDIEKRGKEARDDANKFAKAVIGKEKELVSVIQPEEERLQLLRDEWDNRIERERLAAIEANQRRVDAIKERIQKMRDLPAAFVGKPSAGIKIKLDALRDTVIDEDAFEEFFQDARDAHGSAMFNLTELYNRQVEHEAEQERIRLQDEENARLRERMAQLEREAEEARQREAQRVREEEERVAQAEREREAAKQRRVQKIQDRIEAISRPFMRNHDVTMADCESLLKQAEQLELDPEWFAEFYDEALEARDSAIEQIKETMGVLRQIKADREQREAEEAKQREEAAARQRELDAQAEANRKKAEELERERLKHLTMRDAVMAVIQWASNEGFSKEKVFRDLEAVIDNESDVKRAATKPTKRKVQS